MNRAALCSVLLVVSGLATGRAAERPALPAGPATVPALMFGTAWYPEQWPESRWDVDLALMRDAGMNMVRIGEFAWSTIEPAEGRFELDWMERAIAAAARHGLVTIIGTPTDTPPAWLTSRYPETLRVGEDGRRLTHGARRHFSIGSARYRELCARVVDQLARRFGPHPQVVAWQIGNEYTEDSFDPESRSRFQRWLAARYGSLDALNRRWGTAYWSQTYYTWEQVPLPVGRANPSLLLDYKRYVTDTWRSFQSDQLAVLRRFARPGQLITTNLGGLGWATRFDRQQIAADLDVISWDEYLGAGYLDPARKGTGHLDPDRSGSTHALVRGWKQRNHWIMEMAPGFIDWSPGVNNALDPGETRAMAWHAVGHGADCVAFWQWRGALNGQEQYHGAILGPDGEPLPVYAEIARAGRDFAAAAPALAGTSPTAEVAILHDYDSRWAVEFSPFSSRYDQLEVLQTYYRALRARTQAVDIVTPAMDLSRYRLIVAPTLNVISAETAARLRAYVEAGGHLVLGPRSGMKDECNALHTARQPGPLAEPLGARVEQFYALLEDVPVAGAWGGGRATLWAEHLAVRAADVEIVLRYGPGHGWLEDQPAAVQRPLGRGRIGYLGAVLDEALTGRLVARWLEDAAVRPTLLDAPARVSVSRRVAPGREVFVVTNFSATGQTLTLPGPMQDLLGDGALVERIELPRYGVAVLLRRPEVAP